VVAYNADGRLEVFAVGPDQALWHIRQTMPGSDWGVWASLGGWVANPVSKFNLDGRLEVFARGSDNALWHIEMTSVCDGWNDWVCLGGWVDTFTVA